MIVKGSIDSLKVAATCWLRTTPMAPFAGSVELTVGAVVSGTVPVVKLHTLSTASALPARSLAPVVIVAVYSGARRETACRCKCSSYASVGHCS